MMASGHILAKSTGLDATSTTGDPETPSDKSNPRGRQPTRFLEQGKDKSHRTISREGFNVSTVSRNLL
jgi:hypothetical protein